MTQPMTQTTSEPAVSKAASSACPTGVDVAAVLVPPAPRAEPADAAAAATAPPGARGEPLPPPRPAGGTTPVLEMLPIDLISCAAHARAGVDAALVRQYAEVLVDGRAMSPVQACRDEADRVHAFDGIHTLKAAESIGLPAVAVVLFAGELRDAKLRAAGANATHGKPRSKQDRARAVERVLDVLGPEVANRTVADIVQLSDKTVDAIRTRLGLLSRFKQKKLEEGDAASRTRVRPERAMAQALAALVAPCGQLSPAERVRTPPAPEADVANVDPALCPQTASAAVGDPAAAGSETPPTPPDDAVTTGRYVVHAVIKILANLAGGDTLARLAEAHDVALLEELRGALGAVQEALPRQATP